LKVGSCTLNRDAAENGDRRRRSNCRGSNSVLARTEVNRRYEGRDAQGAALDNAEESNRSGHDQGSQEQRGSGQAHHPEDGELWCQCEDRDCRTNCRRGKERRGN
jgi:hypothetical protein